MISCRRVGNETVHAYYNEIKCWEGLHIFHAIMAAVVSLVFVLISLIVTLTFYETKMLTLNAGSR
jgi:hypothetical protein